MIHEKPVVRILLRKFPNKKSQYSGELNQIFMLRVSKGCFVRGP